MIPINEILVRVAIFILGFCGFWVSRHIYHHKKQQKPLICPIRFDCNTVVNSDFSTFFGIPVEVLGMVYYALVSLSYLSMVLLPGFWLSFFSALLLGLSSVAFVFSLYLIGVQIFALKKGCSWCFVSAIISTLIFVLSFTIY